MNKNSVMIAGKEWERVTKRTAYKMFLNDKDTRLALCPCKANPCNFWVGLLEVSDDARRSKETLDSFINAFIYYNCGYNELGRYPAYYVMREKN